MGIDVNQLVEDMKNAATAVLDQDITTLKGFSERQLKAIAQQAAFVEAGIKNGGITEETREFFLDSLKDMAKSFVNVLVGLAMVTIEKVWNSIVGVIWKAIEAATGIVLPVPSVG